ncbi:MAG: hypothetical protein VYD85_09835, partial [Pseudomonadota bacterium]|nr:hypothetical protein [Pseudomonadota bacterium]
MPMLNNPLIDGDTAIGDLDLTVYPPNVPTDDETIYGATAPGPNEGFSLTPDNCFNNDGADGCIIDDAIPPGLRAVAVKLASGPFNFQSVDGRWYVRVRGLDAEEVGRYQISVTMDRQFPLCLDDAAESNDTLQTAFNLMTVDALTQESVQQGGGRELPGGLPVQLTNLNLCDAITTGGAGATSIDRQDYYRVTLGQGDDLDVTMIRTDSTGVEGNAFAEILSDDGTCVSDRCACDACDDGCAAGYSCGDLDGQNVCLKDCANEADCPPRFSCVNNHCEPVDGICNVSANGRVSARGADLPAGDYLIHVG